MSCGRVSVKIYITFAAAFGKVRRLVAVAARGAVLPPGAAAAVVVGARFGAHQRQAAAARFHLHACEFSK